MSKEKLQLLSPLFLKYQSDFEKNPRSKVFAPLAEMYRKIGMLDKAMEILASGIRYNPSYVMGYLGMAFCYFDLKQFNLAYTSLRPLVEANRDNIRLQRLFADVCLELGKKEESLETFKYLLFINPRDKVVADLVIKIEAEIERLYQPVHKPIFIPVEELSHEEESKKDDDLFDVNKLDPIRPTKNELDDWTTINLNQVKSPEKIQSSTVEEQAQDDYWSVKKIDEPVLASNPDKSWSEDEDRSFHITPADESSFEPIKPMAPLVTHTLVDLYCGQGHIEKALEVLDKILLLNPSDQRTLDKKQEILALMAPLEEEVHPVEPLHAELIHAEPRTQVHTTSAFVEDFDFLIAKSPPLESEKTGNDSEEEGRNLLMSLIDQTVGPSLLQSPQVEPDRSFKIQKVEDKLNLFLRKIQQRALEYQSRI